MMASCLGIEVYKDPLLLDIMGSIFISGLV